MKLSSNTVGMLIFAALAATVFVLMAMRPAMDGNAMNLGVPLTTTDVSNVVEETTPAVLNETTEDATLATETTTSTDSVITEETPTTTATTEESSTNIESSTSTAEPSTSTETVPADSSSTDSSTSDENTESTTTN